MSDRTPNWPGALKKTNFQIHSCHPQSGSNPGPWILTTGTVLYQLSWVEAVTHPITNTAQWCLTSVMYEIPVYQLYHSATDKSLGWGTTLLSCVLQSRSWCSEPCHEFRTTWPLVLLSYKDTRSELTAHLILYHVRVQSLILPFLGLELTMMMRLRDFYIMQRATASLAPGS